MRIASYEFGKVVDGGETHTRDVIIHPRHVEGEWRRKERHRLDTGDLTIFSIEANRIAYAPE